MTDLARLSRDVDLLTNDLSVNHVLEIRERVAVAAARIREIREDLDRALIAYMAENGDIPLGDGRRLYTAVESTTRVRDKAAALEALVRACGGDVATLASYLTSQPIKHGAAKKLLGDDWGDHFLTETKKKAKGGAAKLTVREHDPRFT